MIGCWANSWRPISVEMMPGETEQHPAAPRAPFHCFPLDQALDAPLRPPVARPRIGDSRVAKRAEPLEKVAGQWIVEDVVDRRITGARHIAAATDAKHTATDPASTSGPNPSRSSADPRRSTSQIRRHASIVGDTPAAWTNAAERSELGDSIGERPTAAASVTSQTTRGRELARELVELPAPRVDEDEMLIAAGQPPRMQDPSLAAAPVTRSLSLSECSVDDRMELRRGQGPDVRVVRRRQQHELVDEH